MGKKDTTSEKTFDRPPVIAIVGHIDHGKSTLLDHIRKSNIVDGEAGGITQHVSAYEVSHKDKEGTEKKITFIDTPGHSAFMSSRRHGVNIADIAILIVSAEDGVKDQTKESLKLIKESDVPFIVAINKVDKPNANSNKVKQELAEVEVLVEGYGGKVPVVEISAKTGQGIEELLDIILLLSEIEENLYSKTPQAEGFVLEGHIDPKAGITGVFVIKNGVLKVGDYIVIDEVASKIKRLTTTNGELVKEASPSTPVQLIGLSSLPVSGSLFYSTNDKKKIKKLTGKRGGNLQNFEKQKIEEDQAILPLVIKADTQGTLDAICSAVTTLSSERLTIKILSSGIGNINEADMHFAASATETIIIAFNVGIDKTAEDASRNQDTKTEFFDVIYKITEYLEPIAKTRTPILRVEEEVGRAKIIKIFNKQTKNKQLIGAHVSSGNIYTKKKVNVIRNEHNIGTGRITELQVEKSKKEEVEKGAQFGGLVESKITLALGDILQVVEIVEK